MRKIFIIILLCIATILLFACENDPPVENTPLHNGILHLSLSTQIQTVDPAYAQSDGELLLSDLVYSCLVDIHDGEITPELADAWQVSSDGLIYTFYLRKGVLFHNGKEMTADDVKFSFERILRLATPTSYIFTNVKGADEVLQDESKTLSGIEVVDPYTLKITLIKPQENFLTYLAMPAASVLDRNELVQHGANFALASTDEEAYPLPSGTGPFSLGEYLEGKSVALGMFEEYFMDSSHIERIELLQNIPPKDGMVKMEAGTIDVVQNALSGDASEGINIAGFIQIQKPVRLIRYLVINPNKAPFNNQELRRAVFSAISGNDIVNQVRNGFGICPAEGLCSYWYNLSPDAPARGYDTQTSINKLAEAGYPNGSGLPSLTLLCGPNVEDIKIAKKVASDLSKIGCKLTVKSLSYRELRTAIRQGDASFYLGTFSDKGGGLDIFFSEVVDSRYQGVIGDGSWTSILNSAYDASEKNKLELFSQVEQQLTEQGILLCLYFEISDYAIEKSWSSLVLDDSGTLNLNKLLAK
ncbi:MAG: ABC transporter substrate-binding protein [Bacillota bacterium]|jgi:ABC-type transport system substrate-binding protein